MSTYNGEKYVREQIQSILVQLPANGMLLIRDDGSCDQTIDIIKGISDARVSLLAGQNIGFAASFLTLLRHAPEDADMVMFSDQDDVWLKEKIDRAWNSLSTVVDRPALYCSAQILVDENLRFLERTRLPDKFHPSFRLALTENIVTGCTMAMNRDAAVVLRSGGIPNKVKFHDWWAYLVISAFGVVIVDQEPTILYRQHGKNLIGKGAGWLGRNLRIVRFLLKNDWTQIMLDHVSAFIETYGHLMNPSQRELLQLNFEIKENGRIVPSMGLITSRRRWRSTVVNELFFRLLLLCKRVDLFR